VGSFLVAERGFPQALPVGNFSVDLLGGRTSLPGSCGLSLCCMALSASGVYYLTGDQLRQSCVERGLNSDGPVRALRRRLAEYLRGANMDGEGDQDDIQAEEMGVLRHELLKNVK